MQHLIRHNIREMTAYKPGKQVNIDVIKLNTNENPFPPSPKVLEQLQATNLEKYPNPTASPLRQTIANLYKFDKEQVIVGNGSDEILSLLFRTFVEEKEIVSFFNPSYSLYNVLANIHNCSYIEVNLKDDFSFDKEQCLSQIKNTKMFFITRPNAPTGILFPLKDIEFIAKNFQGVLIIDEAYADFAKDNCLSLCKQYNNIIIVRTLSKSYSLAALRVGFALGSKIFIEALDKARDSYNVNLISQKAAQAALIDQKYHKECLTKIIQSKQKFITSLQKLNFQILPSETNFIFVKPPVNAKELYNHLQEKKILVRFFNTPTLRDYLRISIGTDEQMQIVLETISKFIS